ncbi:helix-turn-helix domain-containing protein [Streptomyces sp. 4N509B]|uniref:helix-turn-helix domain-containing protein n=1 Tax=Streptomyces sp. 4N509B TaxID=3457413 RepID=UPI003FCF7B0A
MESNTDDHRTTPQAMLARRLEKLRTKERLTLRELAEQVGYPHTYIHRVEKGQQAPSDDLAKALDNRFDTDGLFAELLEASRESEIKDYSRAIVTYERKAVRIQAFGSSVVPGLLQTESYALELFRSGIPGESDDKLRARVDARMQRKRIFDTNEPPFYWAIMDESALKRPIGGGDCMSTQLAAILEATEKPQVAVQVLPFAQGAHPMLGGSLNLLALAEGGTVGLVESFKNGEFVESPKKIAELVHLFELACSKALPGKESSDLISTYLKEYRNEGS